MTNDGIVRLGPTGKNGYYAKHWSWVFSGLADWGKLLYFEFGVFHVPNIRILILMCSLDVFLKCVLILDQAFLSINVPEAKENREEVSSADYRAHGTDNILCIVIF